MSVYPVGRAWLVHGRCHARRVALVPGRTVRKMSSRHEGGQVALQNRLPPKHPQRLALETAIRSALAGLKGSWDVVLEAPEGLSLVIAVVGPEGSAWTMSCCNPAYRDPESIAETVRAACSRRRWLDPANAARGKAKGGAECPAARAASKSVAPPTSNREPGQASFVTPGGTMLMSPRAQNSGGKRA